MNCVKLLIQVNLKLGSMGMLRVTVSSGIRHQASLHVFEIFQRKWQE